jgi:hypothetical protein
MLACGQTLEMLVKNRAGGVRPNPGKSVQAPARPTGPRRIDILPTADQPLRLFETSERRIHGPRLQVGSLRKLEPVPLGIWCRQHYAEQRECLRGHARRRLRAKAGLVSTA